MDNDDDDDDDGAMEKYTSCEPIIKNINMGKLYFTCVVVPRVCCINSKYAIT